MFSRIHLFCLFAAILQFQTVSLRNTGKIVTQVSAIEWCECYYNYRLVGTPKSYCTTNFCGCSGTANYEFMCCAPCVVKVKKSCFPGDSRLLLEDGSLIQMRNLKPGQKIETVQNGRRVFLEVKTFLKRQPNLNFTQQTITTESGNSVSMSADHFVFVSKNNNSEYMVARSARSVKPGDYIFSTNSCPDGLCPERVVQISHSLKQGLYVPLTDSGTLVVDGIFSSSHSSLLHDFDHFFVTPFLWFPWLLEPWQQDGWSPIVSNLEKLGIYLFYNVF